MASRKKKIWLAVAVVAVLGAVVAVSVTRDSRSKVAVQTQKVGRKDLVSVVSASGEVKPKRTSTSAPTSRAASSTCA